MKDANKIIRGIGIIITSVFIFAMMVNWCPSGKRDPRIRPPQKPPVIGPGGPQVQPGGPFPKNPPKKETDNGNKDQVKIPDPINKDAKTITPTATSADPANVFARPAPGIGLAPYIWEELFSNSLEISRYLPMWENWWIRNRLNYLNFKEPIAWFNKDVSKEEGTISMSFGQRNQILNTLRGFLKEGNDSIVRADAALAMAKFKDKSVIANLLDILNNKEEDINVRNVVSLALGMMGEEKAVAGVKAVLSDSGRSPISRSYAALALGYSKNNESAEAIKEIFKQNGKIDKEIQCSAMLAIGNMEDKSLIPFVVGILNDVNRKEEVRAYAALALGRIKDASALPELKKALNNQNDKISASAAIALGLIKSPESKDDLLKMINKERASTEVKFYSMIALAKLGDKSIIPVLIDQLKKSKDYFMPSNIILALGVLGDESASGTLRKIVESKDQLKKNAAILALGMIKDKESVPLLIKIVEKEENDEIGWPYAIQALGMIGDERAIPVLEKAFEKASESFYLSANAYDNIIVSLAMLGKRNETLSSLFDMLKDKDVQWETKSRILHGIGYIGNKESVEKLIGFAKEQEYDYLNMDIVYALGYILDKDTVNPLYKITADTNFHINLQIINHIFMSRPD